MKEIIINDVNKDKKLFRFIQTALPQMKNTEIFRIIRKGVIKVNDKPVNQDYILKSGDIVKIFISDNDYNRNKPTLNDKYKSINTKFNIIFEDKEILVINKDSGVIVHPDKNNFKNTLSESVKAYLYKKREYNPANYFTPSPCHRLDTNTSGIIVFAKTQPSLKKITGLFRERDGEKKYLTIILGKLTKPILITSKIDTRENRENKVIVSDLKVLNIIPNKEDFVKNNNFLSATLVKPIKSNSQCSLVEIDLWTGKKHQIRAHMLSAGHAILGERKYYSSQSLSLSQLLNFNNYFLHCSALKIGDYDQFTADIPNEFQKKINEIFV